MIFTLDTEYFPHDRPKYILRMRVILLLCNRFPAGQTAEHQDARIRSLDGWKSVRCFHAALLLILPLRPEKAAREHFHIPSVARAHNRIIRGDIHAANRLAQQHAVIVEIEVDYIEAACRLIEKAKSL